MIRHASKGLLVALALATALSACGGAGSNGQLAVNTSPSPSGGTAATSPDNGSGSGPGNGSGNGANQGRAATATVPDVTSEPTAAAEQALQQAGFVVGAQQPSPDSMASGNVINTNPVAGSTEPSGSVVNLTVSSGLYGCGSCLAETPVPNVIGQTLSQAETALTADKLAVAPISYQESVIPRGQVIESTPPPGAIVPFATPVTLVVSTGPAILGESVSPSA